MSKGLKGTLLFVLPIEWVRDGNVFGEDNNVSLTAGESP